LMQDPIYRADIRMNSMGYYKPPMTSYCLEAESPGLNLTAMTNNAGKPVCRVVVSASLREGLAGVVQLEGGASVKLSPNQFAVNLKPGERHVQGVEIEGASDSCLVRATLTAKDRILRGQVPIIGRRK
ncbi:MAG: hypothetical protein N2689_12420, partial [Verrucomicrobiae bacterium]|nr:hypothetical protein [Verrucomicrobiae bacterium]